MSLRDIERRQGRCNASVLMANKRTDYYRPARVRIPRREAVTLTFGSKRVTAALSKVSVTGGVLHVSKSSIHEPFADITIPTIFGPVCSPIELLTTGVPGMSDAVAFRFLGMDGANGNRLKNSIENMIKNGLGEKRDAWFQTLARRIRNVYLNRSARA